MFFEENIKVRINEIIIIVAEVSDLGNEECRDTKARERLHG